MYILRESLGNKKLELVIAFFLALKKATLLYDCNFPFKALVTENSNGKKKSQAFINNIKYMTHNTRPQRMTSHFLKDSTQATV